MNKVILIGRLTKDPVIYGNVAKYTLAVDRKFKQEGQPTADFLQCVVFGKQKDFVEQYLNKGMKIAVTGRIQTGSYDKDGQKVYTTDIIVEDHEFCESKQQGNSAYKNDDPFNKDSKDDFVNIPDGVDDEIPFL